MNYPALLIIIVFFLYTFVSWSILGPLPSLSSSFYKWKDRNYSAIWSIFSAIICFLCILQDPFVKDITTIALVLSGVFMWALTISANYKQYPGLHYGATVLSIIAGFFAVFFEFGWGFEFISALSAFAVMSLAIIISKTEYKLTLIELVAPVCIMNWFIWR